ncbi:hypothetical protein IR141_11540 [Neisseria sp. 19428wB4_WF04]|uniref:hypothetical protein n=1 Tax=Neisseria musculi TaxID=1815583 RepID=UPI00164BA304|nr:hypothetical protein [Neisseria musculi]MBF0804921.1 hypothetical protein [Neisseria sp. 19428wB4_WF04]
MVVFFFLPEAPFQGFDAYQIFLKAGRCYVKLGHACHRDAAVSISAEIKTAGMKVQTKQTFPTRRAV